MADATNLDLLVNAQDVREIKFVESPAPAEADLQEGEIFIRVEKFGFSANNVTYAVLGEMMRYFDFFPTTERGWGKIPVWGMGRIVHSRHAELPVGTRMYGYFPLARSVTLRPSEMTLTGFEVDRGDLAKVYNQYWLNGADPFHLPANEDQMMIFRPLFFTSVFLDDYLADGHEYFGAQTVLVTSASSKTSYGTAYMHARRYAAQPLADRCAMIGLTSPGSRPFVEQLGFYDRIVTYDDLASIPADTTVVIADVAGNLDTLTRAHEHFGDNLKKVVTIGLSHWDKSQTGTSPAALQAKTELFFVPSWIEKRQVDWGMERLVGTMAGAWQAFMADVDARCRLTRSAGRDAVGDAYNTMVTSRSKPDEGSVLSLWDDAFA